MSAAPLLQIRHLRVTHRSAAHAHAIEVLHGVDLSLRPGEILGLAGESGSGKTQLLLAILALSGARAERHGSIRYRDQELLGLPGAQMNRIRGARIGMIFQDPAHALNPYLTVGRQLTETLQAHRDCPRREAERRALEMLEAVHLAEAARRLRQYPHELSGGMRQRVMIAMALIAEPDIVLADEPTTALDVTVQAQILRLLLELRERTGVAILLVTHDMGVIAELADRVAVMYAGRVVEQGPVQTMFADPLHPYTQALQACVPRPDRPAPARLASIAGGPPDPTALPAGCAFAARCIYRLDQCDVHNPELLPRGPDHWAACHHRGPLDDRQRGLR
jgi:oligopeptide/dipeptide ABC transporter ATP-binding protein